MSSLLYNNLYQSTLNPYGRQSNTGAYLGLFAVSFGLSQWHLFQYVTVRRRAFVPPPSHFAYTIACAARICALLSPSYDSVIREGPRADAIPPSFSVLPSILPNSSLSPTIRQLFRVLVSALLNDDTSYRARPRLEELNRWRRLQVNSMQVYSWDLLLLPRSHLVV